MQVLPTAFGEVAGQDPQHLVQIGDQRAVRRLLNAEVLEHRNACRTGNPAGSGAQQLGVDAAALGEVVDVHCAQRVPDRFDAGHMLGEKRLVAKVFLNQDRGQRADAPRIGAGPHPQVEVGHFGGVGQYRVDDDHGPLRILRDVLQHGACARETLRHPRVLPDEHRHLGVLELAAGMSAVELCVDPELAGLLLRQGV